jgi:ferritin
MAKIDETLASALNAQANHERFAAACYEAMAYWCESEDYDGFAGFFNDQATEEREHAQKFFQHLLDRGVAPEVGALDAPKGSFGSLVEVARFALKLEEDNSVGITKCLELAIELKDHPSKGMLVWFVTEQVEEEAWANKMVTLTERLGCDGAVYNLDRHIVKQLGGGEH